MFLGTRIIFKSKREKEIYEDVLKFINEMVDAANCLKDAIISLCTDKCDENLIESALNLVKKSDANFGEITLKVITLIKEASEREDMLKFIFNLQKIAKSIEAAIYRVSFAKNLKINNEIKEDFISLANNVLGTLKSFQETILNMPFKTSKATKFSKMIHELEENVDIIRRKLVSNILKIGDSLTNTEFYILMEIIEKLEDISDNCDEAGVMLEIIIASEEARDWLDIF